MTNLKESHSTTKPSFFYGSNYLYWKIYMSTFLQAMDLSMWMSIQQSWKRPTTAETDWDDTQKKAHTASYKALNVIFCVISQNEFRRIYSLTMAKESWNLLEVTHEEISVVKKSKLQMLPTKFKERMMDEDE